jgi:TrmH family RNA methyltransferase
MVNPRPYNVALAMAAGRDNLNIVLVRTRNPLNIGAATRAMSNFGFEHLRVVNPYDVAFREARSAVGAAKLLAGAGQFKNVADAVADCTLVVGTSSVSRRELQHQVHRLDHGGSRIRERLKKGKVALLFGSEKVGLSNRDLSHCHWLLRIPTREEHSSMNLAQAVAVCLYELVREGEFQEAPEKTASAPALELDRFTDQMLDVLCASGYLKSRSANAEEKIRRLVRRLSLNAQDTQVWLGVVRQIAWKLRNKV